MVKNNLNTLPEMYITNYSVHHVICNQTIIYPALSTSSNTERWAVQNHHIRVPPLRIQSQAVTGDTFEMHVTNKLPSISLFHLWSDHRRWMLMPGASRAWVFLILTCYKTPWGPNIWSFVAFSPSLYALRLSVYVLLKVEEASILGWYTESSFVHSHVELFVQ